MGSQASSSLRNRRDLEASSVGKIGGEVEGEVLGQEGGKEERVEVGGTGEIHLGVHVFSSCASDFLIGVAIGVEDRLLSEDEGCSSSSESSFQASRAFNKAYW